MSSKRHRLNLFQELQKVSDSLRGRGVVAVTTEKKNTAASVAKSGGALQSATPTNDAASADMRSADDVLAKYGPTANDRATGANVTMITVNDHAVLSQNGSNVR
jgi:hypothetical protein